MIVDYTLWLEYLFHKWQHGVSTKIVDRSLRPAFVNCGTHTLCRSIRKVSFLDYIIEYVYKIVYYFRLARFNKLGGDIVGTWRLLTFQIIRADSIPSTVKLELSVLISHSHEIAGDSKLLINSHAIFFIEVIYGAWCSESIEMIVEVFASWSILETE